MKISILSFTSQGFDLGKALEKILVNHTITVHLSREYGGVAMWTEDHFSQSDALVFVGSTGIVVRSIAPYIQSKVQDPAVIVLDEGGSFVIPLLSGHVGGGNALGKEISQLLNNTLVLTTATDVRGVFAVDNWAISKGYSIDNPKSIVKISSALLEGKEVGITSPYKISIKLPKGVVGQSIFPQILVSPFKTEQKDTLWLVPKTLTLGMGCRKDTPFADVEALFLQIIEKHNIHPKSFHALHSIELKKDEKGLLEFSKNYNIPFTTFTSEELNNVSGTFTGSDFVKSVTGVDNVCERSAVIGKQNKQLVVSKTLLNGVTIAIAEDTGHTIELD